MRWRFAGLQPCCTFRGPSDVKAIAAKQYIEAQHHQVTASQVYAAIDPDSRKAPHREPTPLLRDWIETWVAQKVDVSPGTHAEYARLLRRRVVRDLGDLRVGDITRHEHLDPWKAALSRELMPAGVVKHWQVLSQVMRDAVPHLRPDNPMERPRGRRGNGLPRPVAYPVCLLTGEEAGILVTACREPAKPLVLAALGTGMRLGELLGLRVRDVRLDTSGAAVHVVQALLRDGSFGPVKTRLSRRTILLAPSTAELFAGLTCEKRPDELVFTAPDGGPWDANNLRRRYWQTAVIAAQRCPEHPPADWVSRLSVSTCRCRGRLHGSPRFHDLRHSHVAYLIAAGWDFYMIQLRLGHASIRTTFDTYGHLLPHGESDRLEWLDEQLPPSGGPR
ncbi:site-specific integrase [Actinoplanes sp. NPDC051861]|uniref:tyrosine-type recombinase/integrase n=1 Tax=Actinoplanes sp. NPDC051861 TaxID=3155170 RepID=UPI003442B16D